MHAPFAPCYETNGWMKKIENPMPASTAEMIQKRMTTLTSLHPFFSKWWCKGAIRKMRVCVRR